MLSFRHVRSRRSFVATLAITTITSTIVYAQSQETYSLRDKHAVGDVVENETMMDMSITIDATTPDETLPPMRFTIRERAQYREDVLAVNARGKIDGFRRSYSVNRKNETTPDNRSKTTVSSLQGKTIAVRRQKGQPVVTVAKGKIAAADRKDLMESLNAGQMDFFPAGQVTIGKEWKVPSKSLSAMFPEIDSATATGKLLEFVTYENQRCARVQVTMNMAVKLDGPNSKMTMKLTGDLYQSMELERPLSFVAEGPVTINGEEKSPQGKIQLKGTGTMKMQMISNWLKVAGKSVTIEPVVIQ